MITGEEVLQKRIKLETEFKNSKKQYLAEIETLQSICPHKSVTEINVKSEHETPRVRTRLAKCKYCDKTLGASVRLD